jgi:hypothetical protein
MGVLDAALDIKNHAHTHTDASAHAHTPCCVVAGVCSSGRGFTRDRAWPAWLGARIPSTPCWATRSESNHEGRAGSEEERQKGGEKWHGEVEAGGEIEVGSSMAMR